MYCSVRHLLLPGEYYLCDDCRWMLWLNLTSWPIKKRTFRTIFQLLHIECYWNVETFEKLNISSGLYVGIIRCNLQLPLETTDVLDLFRYYETCCLEKLKESSATRPVTENANNITFAFRHFCLSLGTRS